MKNCLKITLLVIAALLSAACERNYMGKVTDPSEETATIIFYACAYNNLSSDIRANVEFLEKEALPLYGAKKKLMVYMHASVSDNDFTTPTSSCLVQMSRDYNCEPRLDTIKTYAPDLLATDPGLMRTVLLDAKQAAPSDHYGLILSSHGTGWLPEGYYSNGEQVFHSRSMAGPTAAPAGGFPVIIKDDGLPKTKSFGAEFYKRSKTDIRTYSHEMNLTDLAEGLPYKFDYIIFDACLMGGIETAWELREKADKICFSPAEILAQGFDYSAFGHALIKDGASPEEFAEAFFNYYNSRTGAFRTATITVVDCGRLQPLADVCRALFEKYRGAIADLNPDSVQPYFRDGKHWFYDLEDILVKAGINPGEKDSLESALDGCISYKAATPTILELVDIVDFCGLSMYLPCDGSENLDKFYKGLSWNKASALVE